MSNSLAKKFDKIVSKLGNKHKESKLNGNEPNENQDENNDGNTETQHESLLSRMKGHLGHGSAKNEHQQQTEGAPPLHIIADDLKDSPFKGKRTQISLVFFRCQNESRDE